MLNRFTYILSLFVIIIACKTSIPVDDMMNDQQNEFPTELTFLALGDSYTIGQSVPFADRWPNQIKAAIDSDTIIIKPIEFIAQTGWNTTKLLQAMADAELVSGYDLVTLSIGVNNQYQGLPFQLFKLEFDSLLTRSIELATSNEKLLVVSIPDYGVTPFGAANAAQIAEEIDEYNDYISASCALAEVKCINITDISRTVGNDGLTFDELHPNGLQYGLWVERILPFAEAILIK